MRNPQDLDVLIQDGISGSTRRPMRVLATAAVAGTTVAVDQLSKRWALGRLTPGSCAAGPDACIELPLNIKLHLVFNTGAAWSTGSGMGPLLGVLASVIVVVMAVMVWRSTSTAQSVLFGLVGGGAIGNLVDRVTRADDGFLSGAVVDFIDLGWWPVFNIADSAIVCGIAALMVMAWRTESSGSAER